MTEEEFCALEEYIDARIENHGSIHIEDQVRVNQLRQDFIDRFIFGDDNPDDDG